METRVYVIFIESSEEHFHLDNDEWFMNKAEEQGTVYTLFGFQNAINSGQLYLGDESYILINESEV